MISEIPIVQGWLKLGHKAVIAVVAKTWGSAPRRAGSIMVVRDDGLFEGSVSGGCVEGSVITEAIDLISQEGAHAVKTLEFSVASEQAWDVGLACGGEITIFLFCLSPSDFSIFEQLQTSLATRKPVSLSLPLDGEPLQISNTSTTTGKPIPLTTEDSFIVPFVPPIRLDIVGAVHIAQHLAVMARECDFTVRVIDPRRAFSESRTFGNATLYCEWPDDYFRNNVPDQTTAVVTLTHDPKLDDVALLETLKSNAFYIGCLGSRKTHKARIDRLQAAGFKGEHFDKINAPIGLDIGSATPAEIAASILAEIIQTARELP